MTRRIRTPLLALVCTFIALLSTGPASARITPLETPTSSPSRDADSRLGLDGQLVYCTYRLALREPRLASGKDVTGLRLASDPTLRWKGRPLQHLGGVEVYDMRARQWVPELGAFLSIDEYRFHDARGTLWSWPHQNPIRYFDPSGHDESFPPATAIVAGIIGGGATILGMGMSAPSDTSAAPADLIGMMGSVPGPALARLFLEEAASHIPGLAPLLKTASKSRFGPMSNVDCRVASQNLIEGMANPADAQIIEMTAKNGSKLPHNWDFHAAVELADGSVLDPKLGVTFPSVEAWQQGTAAGADVLLTRSPYPRQPFGPPLPGDGL